MNIDVALPVPLYKPFSYRVPDHLKYYAEPGKRVVIPFGKRKMAGFIIGASPDLSPSYKVRTIECILDETPVLIPPVMDLVLWMAEYYMVPPGMAFAAAVPGVYMKPREPGYEATPRLLAARRARDDVEKEVKEEFSRKGRLTLSDVQARPGWLEKVMELAREGSILTRRPEGKKVYFRKLYRLRPGNVQTLLEKCKRSPKQTEIITLLSHEKRPLTREEICAWASCSPSTVRTMARQGILQMSEQRIHLPLQSHTPHPWQGPLLHTLTPEQQTVFENIAEHFDRGAFHVSLIQGVTSSGKTEIYLHAIARAIEQGNTALYLVPEIALTFLPTRRLAALFGNRVSILHSGMNERERTQEFERIRRGESSVVVGPRSAVFSPLKNLKLIIVDEEQDTAFKQENAPCYHGRDTAVMRGKIEGASVLLGTATPSLESRYNVEKGRYEHHLLTRRIGDSALPEVEIVDNRKEEPGEEDQGQIIFSERLKDLMRETFEREQQAILLVTRKGYAPILLCRFCGHNFPCPACSVSHTFHRDRNLLICHYCNHRLRPPATCPECGGALLESIGFGTEKVAERFEEEFPGVPFAVVDRDHTSRRGRLKEILHRFSTKEYRCLIGTQIVAKGHDYPGVTLVGVLTVDQMLTFPDFRNGERAFGLLTQVAGRAGRGDAPGRVVVQTSYPSHYAVRHAVRQDYESFYAREIKLRRALHYPPTHPMILCTITGTQKGRAETLAGEFAGKLHSHRLARRVSILGPSPAALHRLRGRYRYSIMVRGERRGDVRAVVRETLGDHLSTQIMLDVDPYYFL